MSKFDVGDIVRLTHKGRATHRPNRIPDDNQTIVSWEASYWLTDLGYQYKEDEIELVEEEKTMQVPYTINDKSITVFIDGSPKFLQASDKKYEELKEHLKGAHDLDTIRSMVSKEEAVKKYSQGKVVVQDGVVTYEDEEVHNVLTDKLIRMMDEGFDIGPWVAFMNNLMLNPSYRSREQLYGFLEKWDTPITEDGCFLAFKYVTSDFKDAHTKTFDNSPGQVVSMDRKEVDDDPTRTCSSGLHACASHYLGGYAWNNKVVVVKINPRDVVSIPIDYDFSKMRVCQYEVLNEITKEEVAQVESEVVSTWDQQYSQYMDDIADEYYDSYFDSYYDNY